MTTPTGQISVSDIISEFGRAAPDGDTTGTAFSLGKYRVNDSSTLNKPLDVGVPQSGQISFSDLRGKTRTVVFKYTGTISRQDLGNDASALNLRSVYNAAQNAYQGLSISQPLQVGEFESLPSDFNDASKPLIVIAQIEGTLGSKRTTYNNPSEQFVALDTGAFGIGTSIRVEVSSSGKIFGAGGRGGRGSSGSGNGGTGTNGTTAIGVRAGNGSVTIINEGLIQCGFGGGGGGGGVYSDPNKNNRDPVISGGGGGGGAGFPNGLGGGPGTGSVHAANGAAGSNSANQTRGLGGTGRTGVEGTSRSGDGGNGGQNGISPENGDNPSSLQGVLSSGVGGSAGVVGAAIRKKSGASFTLVNIGTIIGSTSAVNYTNN
tara:strand:- start:2698 stop:3822 length:1125 start_codon:yes stop_codon:yes gene_type:complete